MAKKFDVNEAAEWDEEEAAFNLKYLRDRGRFREADEIVRLRGGEAATAPSDSGDSDSTPQGGDGQDDSTPEPDQLYPGFDSQPEKNTVDAIVAWVGEDEVKAQVVWDSEQAKSEGDRRSTLVQELQKKFEFE